MSAVMGAASNTVAVLFAGWALMMLAELAKFGEIRSSGTPWSLTQSLVVPAILMALAFMLAFGAAKQ